MFAVGEVFSIAIVAVSFDTEEPWVKADGGDETGAVLDTGNLLSVAADIARISASFNAVATLLASIVDGGITALLDAGTTLPTASVDGEIDVFNGGAPMLTAAVGRGAEGVFDVEDTLLISVDGWTEEAFSVERVFVAGTLATF